MKRIFTFWLTETNYNIQLNICDIKKSLNCGNTTQVINHTEYEPLRVDVGL